MSHRTFLESFGRSFAPRFGQGLQQFFSILLRDKLLSQRQRQREQFILDREAAGRLRQEKITKQDTGFLGQLQTGTQTIREGGFEKGFLLPELEVPLTEKRQIEILNQLTPKGINRFNAINTILSPAKIIKSPNITSFEVVKSNTIPGQESAPSDKLQQVVTIRNSEGEIISQRLGVPYTFLEKKTDGSDKEYIGVSKEGSKDLNSFFRKQQDLMAKLKAVKNGEIVIERDAFGDRFELDEEDIQLMLNQINSTYKAYVENNRPLKAKTWQNKFNKDFGEATLQDPDSMLNLYGIMVDDYKNGKIDGVTFTMLLNDYRAKYGFDPEVRFGNLLNER